MISSNVSFNSDVWMPALERYGLVTHLTVKLFDAETRAVFGPVHLTPFFQFFEERGYDPGMFSECARRCVAQGREGSAVVVSEYFGLTVIGASLELEGQIVGAAVAGYAFVDFSQMSEVQRLARNAGVRFEELWDVAREQKPVAHNRLVLNGELLKILGDAVLGENYRTRQYQAALRQLQESKASVEAQVSARTRELQSRNTEVQRQSEQLREISNRLQQVENDERRRIARELHDSAGQLLTGLDLDLVLIADHAKKQNARRIARHARDGLRIVQQLHHEIRTMTYLLHPPLLEQSGLQEPLHIYVEGFAKRSGLEVNMTSSEGFGRLPREMELAIFRIVQECLTNIHRHSGSKNASIRLERGTEAVSLDIQDSGHGIPREKLRALESSGSGVGIRGMRERVNQLNGHMNIQSNSRGTRVSVSFPAPRATPLGDGERAEAV